MCKTHRKYDSFSAAVSVKNTVDCETERLCKKPVEQCCSKVESKIPLTVRLKGYAKNPLNSAAVK